MAEQIAVRVAQHYWAFHERARLLDFFVKESASRYGSEATEIERLRGRLRRIQAGEAVEPEPGATITLELSGEQVDLLVEALTYRIRALTTYPEMTREMVLIYVAALYDGFVADTLSTVLSERPEMLRSSKQITHEKVLEFTDRDAIIAHLIERELVEFGYMSVADQADYMLRKLNIPLEASGVSLEELGEIHARRNLFVHNRGVVNTVYLAAVPTSTARPGERLTVDDQYLSGAVRALERVASHLFTALIAKFPVPDADRHLLAPMDLPFSRRRELPSS